MFELSNIQKKYLSLALITLSVSYFTKKSDNKPPIDQENQPLIDQENQLLIDQENQLLIDQEKKNIDKNNNKTQEIFISDSELVKIKKLKELNYLSSRLLNIIKEIPSDEITKPDVILINSIKLLMDSINNRMNKKNLNSTIRIFIESNKKKKILSYNNILSGEILNYLASL
jgi:hypothetical protein